MDPIYFFGGGLVLVIFALKRELLVQRMSFVLIFGAAVILFCVGVVLHFTAGGRYSASGSLLCPLLSLALYSLFRKAFLKWQQREPLDTFLNWSSGLGPDNLFNVIYFSIAICLWIFTPLLMQRLAKAGW